MTSDRRTVRDAILAAFPVDQADDAGNVVDAIMFELDKDGYRIEAFTEVFVLVTNDGPHSEFVEIEDRDGAGVHVPGAPVNDKGYRSLGPLLLPEVQP